MSHNLGKYQIHHSPRSALVGSLCVSLVAYLWYFERDFKLIKGHIKATQLVLSARAGWLDYKGTIGEGLV